MGVELALLEFVPDLVEMNGTRTCYKDALRLSARSENMTMESAMRTKTNKLSAIQGVDRPGRPKSDETASSSSADADLRELVHKIVHDFNGDTSAFFDSLRPTKTSDESEADHREHRAAVHRLARNI
jgi:hypothetical protein